MIHETITESLGTGAAPPPCRLPHPPGRITNHRCTPARRASGHSLSLAPPGATTRRPRGQTTPRSATTSKRRPVATTRTTLASGRQGPRLAQRPVDLPPRRRTDPPTLPRRLSSRSCRPLPAQPPALVVPEAATARPRTRRRGDRLLAALRVPAHPPRGATAWRPPGFPGRIGLF